MRAPSLVALFSAATLTHCSPITAETNTTSSLVERSECSFGIGQGCVQFFSDGGCTAGRKLGEYPPTCEGNCYQFSSFSSIRAMGSTIWSVDCEAYADINCQNKIGDTSGRPWGRSDYCMEDVLGAQSMKCWFRC